MNAAIYRREAIATIPWEDYQDGETMKRYFLPLIEKGTTTYVKNVQTEMLFIGCGDVLLPVSRNEEEYTNSYVTSPFTHYISYAKEELRFLNIPAVAPLLEGLLSRLGKRAQKSQVNKIIYVNNWLLSTNLYVKVSDEQLQAITARLVHEFPDYLIAFRSLIKRLHTPIIHALEASGFSAVPSRYVYLFGDVEEEALNAKQRKQIRQDKKLIEKHGYEVVSKEQLTEEDYSQIVALYNALYLERYSYHNPQFTERYMKNLVESGFGTVKGLRRNGRLEGVIIYVTLTGVLTTPVLGYDTSLPKEYGMYRMLTYLIYEEAKENKLFLHRSAGAGQFKYNRGSTGEAEYTLLYMKHLPQSRRRIWKLFDFILRRFIIPTVEKKKL
ncbi:GNAT family N-acetyltransferase [Bacillus tianshenii]|nr:GNAT family N-acetyltransferase [Bacillus tianshenii]